MFNNLFLGGTKESFQTFRWVLKWFITSFKQPTNSEDIWYLMPHITHDVKNMCVVQLLILRPPLNIGAWHLSQLFQNVPSHISFHPHVKIPSLCLDVVRLTLKYQMINANIQICNPFHQNCLMLTFYKKLEKYKFMNQIWK
jgi:hypothetical protein